MDFFTFWNPSDFHSNTNFVLQKHNNYAFVNYLFTNILYVGCAKDRLGTNKISVSAGLYMCTCYPDHIIDLHIHSSQSGGNVSSLHAKSVVRKGLNASNPTTRIIKVHVQNLCVVWCD